MLTNYGGRGNPRGHANGCQRTADGATIAASMTARVSLPRRRSPRVLLTAGLLALLLLPLPLPRSTAIAPVTGPLSVAAAAPAGRDLLGGPQRWPRATASPTPRLRPGAEAPLAAADAAAFRAALDRVRPAFGVYGAQFAVSLDGSRGWSGADGVQRDGRSPLTVATPQVIGSVTKTFTAALVLELVDEGRLRLDDPLARYLPQSARIADGVSVRQLLNHSSGVADLYYPLQASLVAQPARAWTPQEVLSRIGPAWFKPGSEWAYSNTNYVLLGLLIERITGQPAGDALTSHLFAPLGLDQTRLMVGADRPPGLLPASWASVFWTAGGVRSTAADLARWGDALYAGDLLTPAARRQMLSFNDHDYGLGARRLTLDGHPGYGHTGMLATYSAILVRLPQQKITMALIANRSEVDVAAMLTTRVGGQPSLLDLALAAAARPSS